MRSIGGKSLAGLWDEKVPTGWVRISDTALLLVSIKYINN